MYKIFLKRESRYPLNRLAIKKMVEDFLKKQKIKGRVEVSLAVVGDRKMRELNLKYRQINEVTSVLAFPQEVCGRQNEFINPPDKVLRLGDIVVSYPQAVMLAVQENKLVGQKIEDLVEHGLRNLLGLNEI